MTAPRDEDGKRGMVWWNGLTENERAEWMRRAENSGRPSDAWAAYKGRFGPQPSFAFSNDGRTAVRLACRVPCPWCGRELRAADVDVDIGDDFRARLVCGGCHRDIILIEPRSE